MRTTLFTLLLAASVGFAADDEKKADTPDKQFAELKKAYTDARVQYSKDMRAAKEKKDQTKINEEFQANHEKLAKQALELAKANLKADFAIEALMLATQDDKTDAEALKVAVDTFGDDARILQLVPMLQYRPDGAKTLAKLADSKNKDVRATVRFQQLTAKIDEIESPRGKMTPADTDKAFGEVATTLQGLVKEYGDVSLRMGRGTKKLAEAAKDVQYTLDNLVVGKVLPDVEASLLEGDKKAKVSDLRGKVVVMDIWATWCGPCRAMIPHEKEMVEHFKDKPFTLVSVSADDKKETLTKFLEKTEMPWTHWYAGAQGKMMETYQIKFFPTIYVLDTKGKIRYKNIRDKELEAAVKKLLSEAEGAQ